MNGAIKFRQADNGSTRVVWSARGAVGEDPISRYFAMMFDSMMGPDFEAGLANLKRTVESEVHPGEPVHQATGSGQAASSAESKTDGSRTRGG